MSVKRLVKAMVAGCAVIVVSAATGLAAQTPQEHQHAVTDQVKLASGMDAHKQRCPRGVRREPRARRT
jgi:hypothetical protein